mgnify:CR=1 FL=1
MILCGEDCSPVCDFCKHYLDDDYNVEDSFAGEGKCLKKNTEVVAHASCQDDFECFRV